MFEISLYTVTGVPEFFKGASRNFASGICSLTSTHHFGETPNDSQLEERYMGRPVKKGLWAQGPKRGHKVKRCEKLHCKQSPVDFRFFRVTIRHNQYS
jgi:hypothetical protein